MAIDKSVDIIGALAEDIQSRIADIKEVKKQGLHIYSQDQLLTAQQNISLPAVMYHYAGIQKNQKAHKVVFFVYLIAQTKSLTAIKASSTVTNTTPVLQELRKALGCSKSPSGYKWELEAELPDMLAADKIIYRQRWSTNYHISN